MSQDRAKNLKERTSKRNAYMTAIYELYDESGETWVRRPKISERAELSQADTFQAEDYWEGLGLVETRTMGPDGSVEITAYGIETVENSIQIAAQEQAELERGAATSPHSQATLATMDIFISHATADSKIASALAELLRAAFNIAPDRIRCTSVNGYRLDAGDNVNERLQKEVMESRVFLGLITPKSVASSFVIFELGARWGAGKSLLPLLAAGAGASALPGPLSAFHAVKCQSDEEVLQFVRNVGQQLEQAPNGAESYLNRVRDLVQASHDAELS